MMKFEFEARNPHCGIVVALCACAAAAGCLAARADCLDELMPRPRIVHRGADEISATHVAHQGGYTLLVRGGKPAVEGDDEGKLYARVTWLQLKKLAGTGSVPDCTIVDWPELKYRGLMLDCGRKIEPPKWTHPGVGGNPKETPLVDEDYWYRAPTQIHLKKGVNYVKMTLPKKGGWKWIGTFTPVFGTSDHPREVPGLSHSCAPHASK